jgi:alkylation response protein AidB-like acyl-CoA dehydrogenase
VQFELNEDQKALRDAIVTFAKAELNDGIIERDQESRFPRDLWLKCGDMGLQGLPVPAEYGGMELDPVSVVAALEGLGYGCKDGGLAFAINAHLLACVVPVWKHGSEEQKKRFLPELCNGRLIAVNAMTEPDTGSDVFAMTTRAVPDGDGFRISGTKTFNSNAPVADVAITYAVTDEEKGYHGGITSFIVPMDTPGVQAGQTYKKLGLRTCPIGEVVFDDAYVGPELMLGGVGAGAVCFSQSMDWERGCLAATHIGTMERLLETAIQYARTRRQFGQPIGKNQAISHRIADMKIRLEAARLLTYRGAERLGRLRSASLDASMAKVYVSESLVQSALDTIQVLGGYGFMVEYEVERQLRDSIGSTIYSGTNEMQRNIIARWIGL